MLNSCLYRFDTIMIPYDSLMSLYLGCHWRVNRKFRVGVRNFVIFSSLKQLPYAFVFQGHALNCLHDFAYWYRCLRRSKLKGMDHFGTMFGEEAVGRCNFTTIWERHGAVACKNRLDIFCRLSTMHERVRQTNK